VRDVGWVAKCGAAGRPVGQDGRIATEEVRRLALVAGSCIVAIWWRRGKARTVWSAQRMVCARVAVVSCCLDRSSSRVLVCLFVVWVERGGDV